MRQLLLLTPLLAFACKDDPTPTDTGDTAPPTPSDSDSDTDVPVLDCNAYEYRGVVYDCDTVDRCNNDATNLTPRLACCECDPQLCLPDPNCPPPTPSDPVGPPPTPPPTPVQVSACQSCHNGQNPGDPVYSGPGISNPHPFGSAAYIECVSCHGGDDTTGNNRIEAHVPAPPQWNDQNFVVRNGDNFEYFNYRTRSGIDKMEPWPDTRNPGQFVDPIDYIQFMNPGDMRAVSAGRSCGTSGCHGGEQAAWFNGSPLASTTGFFSSVNYSMGANNAMGYTAWDKTAADYSWRDLQDPDAAYTTPDEVDPHNIGRVPAVIEYPEYAQYDRSGGDYIRDNFSITAAALDTQIHNGAIAPYEANQVVTGSDLQHLVQEAVQGNCADCHAYSAGANNRYADFRSSGCTSCHMEYSLDGKSRSTDVNVPKYEPANPDAIAAPERSHVDSHQIRNVAKFLPGGGFVRGVSDYACVGCHQGSNRTVLQYWGIRMDQNADVVNEFQYPANPFTYTTTQNDTRLYNPAVGNNTFNGRNFNQHLLTEDYDNDQRDDTPPDIHYEAGLGCIDCHGSPDVHGGSTLEGAKLLSHQSQASKIQCESCHGGVDAYAPTTSCVDYNGNPAECAMDRNGNPLRNVTKQGNTFMMQLRVLGGTTFVPQTKDTVDSSNLVPRPNAPGQFVYSPRASYAMGRLDGNVTTGIGPVQTNPAFGNQNSGFAHEDIMSCNACHDSWTNSCIGCHLTGFYDANPANYFFSNMTGERIVYNFAAEFTYQPMGADYLVVGTDGKITTGQPGMKMFFKYQDINQQLSNVFAFTDRNGNGNNPNVDGRGAYGALSHNGIQQHSVRGRVDNQNEGPKYCVACHNTVDGLADDFNDDGVTNLEDYENFVATYTAAQADPAEFANLDFDLLQVVIGLNTGNYLEHPIKVHMMAGLGSGLFVFDNIGCPVNPLDNNTNRVYCVDANFDAISPADLFNNFDNFNNATYDLDRSVEATGVANGSFTQPVLENFQNIYQLRQGANYPELAGTLGFGTIRELTDPNIGIVLDSWLDADRAPQGDILVYQEDIF